MIRFLLDFYSMLVCKILLMEYVMIEDEKKWLLVLEDTREKPIKRKYFWINGKYGYRALVSDLLGQLYRASNNDDLKKEANLKSPFKEESFGEICKRLNDFKKIYKNSTPISPEVENAFTGKKRVLNLESLYADSENDMNYWYVFINYLFGEDYDIVAFKIPVNISYNQVFKNTCYFHDIFKELKGQSFCASKSLKPYQIAQLFHQFFRYDAVDILDTLKMKYQDSNRMKKLILDYIENRYSLYSADYGDIDKFNVYFKRKDSMPYLKKSLDNEQIEFIHYPNKQEVKNFVISLISHA